MSMSNRPSQHSSRSIVTNKKVMISVARLIACLMMIIIACTPSLKSISSTKTLSSSLMAKGEVLISKGETQRGATPEDYQKPRCQKWSKVSTTMILRPIWSRKQPLSLNISLDFLLLSKLERTIHNFIVKIRRYLLQSHSVWRLRSSCILASIPRRSPSISQVIKSLTRINHM